MNRERLLMIAADVRKVPEKSFDLRFWKSPCGTAGCAIGWHCAKHPEAALKMINYGIEACPKLDGLGPMPSIAAYLDITEDDAFFLFIRERYGFAPTREFVASRIEQYVRDHTEQQVIELKPERLVPLAAPDAG